jgi:hypothetical protein
VILFRALGLIDTFIGLVIAHLVITVPLILAGVRTKTLPVVVYNFMTFDSPRGFGIIFVDKTTRSRLGCARPIARRSRRGRTWERTGRIPTRNRMRDWRELSVA